jgi:galactokinase
VFSREFGDQAEVGLSSDALRLAHTWSDYSVGVAAQLEKAGFALNGTNLLVRREVPIGAGLSSSASIEVATVLALAEESGLSIDRTRLARICQQAENGFVRDALWDHGSVYFAAPARESCFDAPLPLATVCTSANSRIR